jgi:hypothetical protein
MFTRLKFYKKRFFRFLKVNYFHNFTLKKKIPDDQYKSIDFSLNRVQFPFSEIKKSEYTLKWATKLWVTV